MVSPCKTGIKGIPVPNHLRMKIMFMITCRQIHRIQLAWECGNQVANQNQGT